MRDFNKTKRIVIKVGTNVLSKNAKVDTAFLKLIAKQIAALVRQKRQVILVTSGAIGMGAGALGIRKRITEVKMRQACAAVGQGILMHEYQEAFRAYDQKVAQVLLTNKMMSLRKNYVNLKNAMETLLGMQIVPIVNENDCVSTDEIDLAFGDNDQLSALVASKIDAELLIMLTDVKGLCEANPQINPRAKLIPVVYEITEEIARIAGQARSLVGTGGMASKIAAIRTAANSGCRVVLAPGREEDVILRIVAGEEIGTVFLPTRRLSNRKRWILNSRSAGQIAIDPGAAGAIMNKKSLLAVGITRVVGTVQAGDVVDVGGLAKGICRLSSSRLRTLLSKRRKESPGKTKKEKAIVHANDIVLLEP